MKTKAPNSYQANIQYLNSIIGSEIISAQKEKYFFEGKLDEESMGPLFLKFSNNSELLFDCDGDSESIGIRPHGFTSKGTLETDYPDGRYKWEVTEFLEKSELQKLGSITSCSIQYLTTELNKIQKGVLIRFENEEYLSIWTFNADGIHYKMNQAPPILDIGNFKYELKEIKTLHNNGYT